MEEVGAMVVVGGGYWDRRLPNIGAVDHRTAVSYSAIIVRNTHI